MATAFIADLHLDDARPHITKLFEQYLTDTIAHQADALYILGDLVEAWVGDDDDAELPGRIARAIHGVADTGVPVYFMRGNRDFLLGTTFAQRADMTLIPEDWVVHDIQGTPTLLMHGDTLCTDDVEYQQVRARVRTAQWQHQVLAMPLEQRRQLAAQSRDESRDHTGASTETIMDVNAAAVAETMRETGVTRLIHGHTHRPAIHEGELDGQAAQRIVLGDWYEHGSVLWVTPESVDLQGLPVPN